MFTDHEIAVMAHELNRGYNQVIGDPWVDPPWPGLQAWHQDGIIDGVRAVRSGRIRTRRQQHENWLRYYTGLGWVRGPVKDPAASPPTHPLLVGYDDLPPDQELKNRIFRDLVRMLARI